MKAQPDCLPCILSQVLTTARRITSDGWLHRKVMTDIMGQLSRADQDLTPAELLYDMLQKAYRTLGVTDPYGPERAIQNQELVGFEERLRELLDSAEDRLTAAVRLAAAGNAVDALIFGPVDLKAEIHRLLGQPMRIEEVEDFREDLEGATSLMYLFDNAGELVCDRLFMEEIERVAPHIALTGVVRRQPVLHDALMEDARQAGLLERWETVEAGTDTLGIPLSLCNRDFRARFDEADLIVVKGSANYQTLEGAHQNLYFLLMPKCEVVARHFGVQRGSGIFLKG